MAYKSPGGGSPLCFPLLQSKVSLLLSCISLAFAASRPGSATALGCGPPGFVIAGESYFSSQGIQWSEMRDSVPSSPLLLAGHRNWGPTRPSFLCLGRLLLDTHGLDYHGSMFSCCLSGPQSEQGTLHFLPGLFTHWMFSHLKTMLAHQG